MVANFFKPLIPVIAWLLLLVLRPDFSFAELINKIFEITDTEKRFLDLIVISALTSYFLRLIDFLFLYSSKLRPIRFQMYFEDIKNKHNSFTILDDPNGRPVRIKLILKVDYSSKFSYDLIERYFGPIRLDIRWPSKWLVIDVDDLKILKYQKIDGTIHVNISEILGWPSREAELNLAIVSRHTNTKSGDIASFICLQDPVKNLFLKSLVIKSKQSKHLVRL